MEISPQQQAPRAVRVAAYVDATEEHFEPHAISRVDAFEKAVSAAPNLDIQAHVVRNGSRATTKLARGLGYMAAQVAPPVIGQVLLGWPGLLVGAAVSSYLAYRGFAMEAARNLGGAAHQPFTAPTAFWTGTRTYQITPDQTDGIDSVVLAENARRRPATAQELGKLQAGHFREGDTNIVYLTGHGWGPWKIADMLTRDFAGEVGKIGVKPDLVVFESCLMGNLEALSMLQGRARVAVVSEELLLAGGLGTGHMPVRSMLTDAALQGGTPAEIGARMVAQAHGAGVPTLAAIDLEQLPNLLSKLGKLSERLLQLPTEQKAELKEALQQSLAVPQVDHALGGRADFCDLGDFLSKVERLDPSARETRDSLSKTILARTAGPGNEGTTGLSFCTRVPRGAEPIYAGLPVPESFRKLVQELTS